MSFQASVTSWKTKMGYGKQSQAQNIILVFVLMVILIVIFTLIIFKIKGGYSTLADKGVCKTSIMMNDQGSLLDRYILVGGELVPELKLNCPTQMVEINSKNQEEAKYQLAKELYSVCDEFNSGDLNLFGKKEGVFCIIRKKVSFGQKEMKITGFPDYLTTQQSGNGKGTYAQFCSPKMTETVTDLYPQMTEEDKKLLNSQIIDTSKDYAIIFVYAQGEDSIKRTFNTFIGQSNMHNTIYLLVGASIVTGGWIMVGFGAAAAIAAIVNNRIVQDPQQASFFLIREYNAEQLKELGCTELPAKQK